MNSVCRYCRIKVINGPKCANCGTIYLKGCAGPLNLALVAYGGKDCCGASMQVNADRVTDEVVFEDVRSNSLGSGFLKSIW